MLLKSGEVCKFKNKCPHIGVGLYSCFGLNENRVEEFNCALVDDNGNFSQTGHKRDTNGTNKT